MTIIFLCEFYIELKSNEKKFIAKEDYVCRFSDLFFLKIHSFLGLFIKLIKMQFGKVGSMASNIQHENA